MTKPEDGIWHREALPHSAEAALVAVRDAGLLGGFYLAGGTALALRLGHRLSLVLDFFSPDHFDQEALLDRTQTLPGFALIAKSPSTVHTTIKETKVSFLGYAYPILFPPQPFLGVPIADPREIACMKVSAIGSRGAKRDFIDLYVAAQRYGLNEILRLFGEKYPRTHANRIHFLKSLVYFEDAEKDPMPHMLHTLDWPTVKQYFLGEVPRLL